ncbi:MAG: DUF4097 domain-containing protein [Gemmatimonadetes bacterium]|nr:DUF4097 domain-containing protein [Gemmatimonadota bacterium]
MLGKVMRYGMATAALAALCGTAVSAQQENPFRWSGTLGQGQTLEVRGISGDIHAELASGNTAEVVAEKHGRSRDFDRVEVRMVKENNGVTICAVYRPDENPEGCDMRGSHGHDDNIRVSVDYTVKLPAGVDFVGKTVSGDVDARDVRSDVSGSTVSGDVTISTTGKAWGSTVSGDLDVEMGSLDWKDLSFKTVSGDITLRLPSTFAAAVDFESVSGDFDSDFDVTLTRRDHRWVGSHIRGTIGGGGGRTLEVKTVSGDVRIVKM